jgi:hypothetical protein
VGGSAVAVDAVRLVDREKREIEASQELEEPLREESLGSNVEKIEAGGPQVAVDLARLVVRQVRVEARGVDPELAQRRHLIMHQRDQGAHHDSDAVPQDRRYLIAQRLPAAGRHDDESVPASEHPSDDLFLVSAKVPEAEDRLQYEAGIGEDTGSVSLAANRRVRHCLWSRLPVVDDAAPRMSLSPGAWWMGTE